MEWLHSLVTRPGFDETNLALLKLELGLVALVALALARRRRRPTAAHRWTGASLAIAAVIAFFQFFQIGSPEYYHRWDFLQEYVGARYPELAYSHFYECIAVAESELPGGDAAAGDRPAQQARARRLRDLHGTVHTFVEASVALENPAHCRDLFAPARWESFRADVSLFRRTMYGGYWRDAQLDHGYSATPTHGVLARLLIPDGPTTVGRLQLLSALDPLLAAVMFGLIAWSFGWLAMCLSVVFWGVQDLGPFYWMGGAFLWLDWLTCLVASVCLAHRRRFAAAGALLALGAWLRLLPALFFLGPVVLLAASLRRRPVDPSLKRFFAGAALASSLLAGVTLLGEGPATWPAWAHHTVGHRYTNRDNHVSWLQAVTLQPETRSARLPSKRTPADIDRWHEGRAQAAHDRRWLLRAGRALALALCVVAALRARHLWETIPLGVAPLFFLLDSPCYHLVALLPLCLLTRTRPRLAAPLLLAATLTQVCHLYFDHFDDRYTAMSVLVAGLLAAVLASFAWSLRSAPHLAPARTFSE